MGDLTVTGANDLAVVSAKMKRLGEGQLRREMLAGIRKAAKPLVLAARESALANLPQAGGLNEVIAASKFAIRTRTSGASLGVRVIGASRHALGPIDEQGIVRHPVFRNRKVWAVTHVKPGWFTIAMKEHADEPRRGVIRVIDDIARRT